HRVDRAGGALGGVRLLRADPVAPGGARARALPAGLVLRRDLSARPLPLGGAPRGAVPERGHALGGMGVPPPLPAGGRRRRGGAGGGPPALGPAPSRLPLPPRPGRVEPV